MIAHRGASAYAPDNTFAAFDLALAQGADVLELDVRLGADARMLCLHDPCAEGETAGAPCLDAVLERYGDRTRYLVDLKDPEAGWEGEVAALLARRGVLERAMVQSFDLDALARLHRIAPELPLAAVYRRATSAELSWRPCRRSPARSACTTRAWTSGSSRRRVPARSRSSRGRSTT
ncbi:MAG: glycerophosphodiester phosphodiesterase, partial [Actinomycetota bacterium]|nr:glycerophosphodiester phosphodiesterase [Actinomycetota bacterium]